MVTGSGGADCPDRLHAWYPGHRLAMHGRTGALEPETDVLFRRSVAVATNWSMPRFADRRELSNRCPILALQPSPGTSTVTSRSAPEAYPSPGNGASRLPVGRRASRLVAALATALAAALVAALATALVAAALAAARVPVTSFDRGRADATPAPGAGWIPRPVPMAAPAGGSAVDPRLAGAGGDVVEAALALVAYPWQERLPGWQIHFLPPRGGYEGMTYPGPRVIEVYVRPEASARHVAAVIAHELGHAVDVALLTDHDRARWRATRRLPDATPWNPAPASADFATGAGDFAEAFAAWQVGSWSRSTVAGQPDTAALALIAELAA